MYISPRSERRFWVIATCVVLLGTAVSMAEAQTFSAQIQNFWNMLRTGRLTFTTLRATNIITTGTTTQTANGIGTTSTDGLVLANNTPATAGVPVQQAPRIRLRGNTWDTDDLVNRTNDIILENVPLSSASTNGTFRIGFTLNGVVNPNALTLTNTGSLTTLGAITAGGVVTSNSDMLAGSTAFIYWSSRTLLSSPANAALNATNQANNTGIQTTFGGLPTVGTCGTGTVNAKSTNTYGGIVPTGASACTVIFHTTPAFTNTPFCTVTLQGTAEVYRISAVSTTSFTVNFTTAGNPFMYHCGGGV